MKGSQRSAPRSPSRLCLRFGSASAVRRNSREASSRRASGARPAPGAGVGGSVNGAELWDPNFHSLLGQGGGSSRADLSSSARHGRAEERLRGRGLETPIGNRSRRRLALAPDLRGRASTVSRPQICAAHGGGLPALLMRRARSLLPHFPSAVAASSALKKRPPEYLQQLYFDSIVFTPKRCPPRRAGRQLGICWARIPAFPGLRPP